MSEWINLNEIGAKLPDTDNPIDWDESITVWAEWDGGEIEPAEYHYISMDNPCFQRKCGTDEGNEGWNGNVGYVVKWMPFVKPNSPGDK